MARIGEADREHSGHYLSAVTAVTVVVAAMAWFSQNRTLATAAGALGLYALHLLSIRFLLDNQKRQRQVLDAQWEVLQRFIDTTEGKDDSEPEDLVPAMPVDRETPERLEAPVFTSSADRTVDAPHRSATRNAPKEPPPEPESDERSADPVVMGDVVPPVESLGGPDAEEIVFIKEDPVESFEPDVHEPTPMTLDGGLVRDEESYRAPITEVPVPRHFALGTVALVRDLLTPAEVARVLLEQRKQPGKKFGVLAVEMGLLSDSQREELLLAQQEGLFTDAEMRDARQRLREFRENAAHSMAGLD